MGRAIERRVVAALLLLAACGGPRAVPAVKLIDQQGQPITSEALFGGRWSFLFLGFTSCQTVCPATLAQLVAVKRSVARQFPALAQPRYVFVSVDPQRDTPARLASYLAAFDSEFVGATGAPAQIAALSDALTAFYQVGASTAAGQTGVIHSGEVYLLDPAARTRARFSPPLDPDLVARRLVSLMGSFGT